MCLHEYPSQPISVNESSARLRHQLHSVIPLFLLVTKLDIEIRSAKSQVCSRWGRCCQRYWCSGTGWNAAGAQVSGKQIAAVCLRHNPSELPGALPGTAAERLRGPTGSHASSVASLSQKQGIENSIFGSKSLLEVHHGRNFRCSWWSVPEKLGNVCHWRYLKTRCMRFSAWLKHVF